MKAAAAYAAKQFTDRYSDNINVNILIKATTDPNVFGQSTTSFVDVASYDALRSLLAKDASSADDNTTISGGGSVPAGADPISGPHTYEVTHSQAKALGQTPDDTDPGSDGTFTFNGGQAWTYDPNNRAATGQYDFIGVAIHEFSEMMGRNSLMGDDLQTGTPLYVEYDLFHYKGPGVRALGLTDGKGPGRSFSIDNGTTLLKAFNDETANKGDNQDWADGDPSDAFNAFGPPSQLSNLTPVDVRVMDIVGFNLVGAAPTPTPTPSVTPTASPSATPTRLGNISTRVAVQTGTNVLIGGFIVTGTQPKKVLIRAIGPSTGIAGALADPKLQLFSGQTLLEENDNWVDSPNKQAISDTTIPPPSNLESAIVRTLPANNSAYTAQVSGADGGTGIGLVEVYDLDGSVDSKLANISTRGFVQTGNDVMIGGFIVLGQASQKVIIRAIGPSLGFAGALGDPTLELRDKDGNLLQADDNWRTGGQEQEIIATGIAPPDDRESALIRTVPPGNYTAIVKGVGDTIGVALVEVYAVQ